MEVVLQPNQVLLIDIDGLRPDVFESALLAGEVPHLASLLGGETLSRGLLLPAAAPAPSITFCSQASLFTGAHPSRHAIMGNQFFNRFGSHSDGIPRHYAFDIGDTLAFDDAIAVFTSGLADDCMQAPTIYQAAAQRGWNSVVAGNMYFRGASTWLSPSVVDLGRLTKGGSLLGLEAEAYDRKTIRRAIEHISENGMPSILTLYWKGLDDISHREGPGAQRRYLREALDPQVGQAWQAVQEALGRQSQGTLLCAIFSDHGQIQVPADDRHSLRLAFPFERELGHLFDALGLDVHDLPGEDPNVDAVVASNGGLAFVYLQNRQGRWADAPHFERDVLPVARAFWDAHRSGRYAAELEGSLDGVLVRNVAKSGWHAPYQALTPAGELVSLETWFTEHTRQPALDPANRIYNMCGPLAGDLLLVSSYLSGFYFASPLTGVHGGLHPEDSLSTLAFGMPGVPERDWMDAKKTIEQAIASRCRVENGRMASTADMVTGLKAVLGLPEEHISKVSTTGWRNN